MTKSNLKYLFLRNWKNLALLIFAIALFQQCNKTDTALSEANVSKAKAKDYLNQARASQNNSMVLVANYETKIDSVINSERSKYNQLANNTKTVKAKLSEIRQYSATDITQYYKERYNAPSAVIQSENGTTLKDTVSKMVISDLVVGDGAKAEVKILRSVIDGKEAKFQLCDDTVDSLKVGIETMAKNYEKANDESQKAIKQTEKAFRKEKTVKNVYKGALVLALIKIGIDTFKK